MRIDKLEAENFKKFKHETLSLHPNFNLLIGDNGSGKTSVLDALAVVIGLWHKAAPGGGWRNILTEEIRLEPHLAGDRVLFEPKLPTRITAYGAIGAQEGLKWARMIREGGTRTTNVEAKSAEVAIINLVKGAQARTEPLPVLAYYGAGRAWLPANKRIIASTSQRKSQRFDAYHNCLDTRIRESELNQWFLLETAAAAEGIKRPGFKAVQQAIIDCIPLADGVRYDSNLKDIVLSIQGFEQPYQNLSAGQRMMLAMIADIAIKALTLNSYLLGPEGPKTNDPTVLYKNTPGIVLIDELDVHLHPKWQRRVVMDLKRTFPRIQFVCTSHSPQIIGELSPDEIRVLEDGSISQPPRSSGIDSNRVLEELMGATSRNEVVEGLLKQLAVMIDNESFEEAHVLLHEVEERLGSDDPEVTKAHTLLNFLEPKA
jgi:predicted ATP-binding protein involved in virulence